MHRHVYLLTLLLCLMVITALPRFVNLNWDGGNRIQPDEALIVNGAAKIRFFSYLDPGFHDYNGLPIYVLRAVAHGVQSPEIMTIIGRYISAFVSSITVILLFLLMQQFFPPVIAVSSALIAAFVPLSIQLAHLYTTDSILVALFMATLLGMTYYVRNKNIHSLLFTACMLGASIATKNTGYFFAPLPLLMVFFSKQSTRKKIIHMLIFVQSTLLTFFVFSPFSFIDISGYLERSTYLQLMASGKLLFDWTMQFKNTTPLYWLTQTLWAFGPLAVVGPIGMLILIYDWMKKTTQKEIPLVLISLWTIGFSIFLSYTYVKFIRYDAPLVIGHTVGFAYLLHKYHHGLYAIVVLQIMYGVMFSSIYLSPNTSLAAASWITKNIPDNATILREDWNAIIRYEKEPLIGKNLRIDSLNFYTLPDKSIIIHKILTTDYITLDSPKVKNTTIKLQTSNFYSLLENGELGFEKITEFSSYPRIGPIVLNDEFAEETFTIFDHPTIRIYAKKRHLTEQQLSHVLSVF